MMRSALVTVVVAATAVAPLAAQSTDKDTPKAAKEKKICRREMSTGSILAKSTCHTKAEWDAIASANQSDVDRFAAQRSNGFGQQAR